VNGDEKLKVLHQLMWNEYQSAENPEMFIWELFNRREEMQIDKDSLFFIYDEFYEALDTFPE
jgi:hypothetical protein